MVHNEQYHWLVSFSRWRKRPGRPPWSKSLSENDTRKWLCPSLTLLMFPFCPLQIRMEPCHLAGRPTTDSATEDRHSIVVTTGLIISLEIKDQMIRSVLQTTAIQMVACPTLPRCSRTPGIVTPISRLALLFTPMFHQMLWEMSCFFHQMVRGWSI